jgi:hypothetical protein
MRMRTTPSIAAILAGSALLIGLTVTANASAKRRACCRGPTFIFPAM